MNTFFTLNLPRRRAVLLATVCALVALTACQQQMPTAQTNAPGNATGAPAALGTPAGQSQITGRATQNTVPGAVVPTTSAPAALATRVVVAVSTVNVDGALALATPLRTASFDISSRVTAVHVVPGQAVKTGDVLAELDAATLNEALALAEEKLVLKRAEIAQSLAPASKSELSSAQSSLAAANAAYNALKLGPSASTIEQALRSWNQSRNSLYSVQLTRDSVCGFVPGKPDKVREGEALKRPDCKEAHMQTQVSELRLATSHQAYLDAQKPATDADLTRAWATVVQAQAALTSLQSGPTDEQRALYDLQIEQAELSVERARRDLTQAKLLSPCDCVVQDVPFTAGALASGGITLLDTRSVRFHTSNLNERDVVNLKAGQRVTLRLKAFDSTFDGEVAAILPLSSGTLSSAALYTAIINVDSAGKTLLPGMTGQAEIELK